MKIICGFNVNIDAIYDIKGDEASNFLIKYNVQDLKALPQSINSISDFVNGLAFCMQNGIQAELLIQNQAVYQFFKDNFLNKSIIRIGGNAGIMANVLSFKGANVILHAHNPSDTIFSFMLKKNDIIVNSNVSKLNKCKEDEINFIFDFKKNDKISFENKTITIPRENRFIASSANTNYSIDPDFKKYVNNHINEINGAIFSGFHVLSKEKYKEFIEYVKSIKQKNNNILIHVELGHFVESELNEISFIFFKLSESVNSIGMNESELAALFKNNHFEILNMDARYIIDAAIKCKSLSNLKKIIIHTREFVISIFDSTFGTNVRWRKPKVFDSSFGTNVRWRKPKVFDSSFGTNVRWREPKVFDSSSTLNANNKYIEPILELKALQYGIKSVARFAAIGKLDNKGIECKLYKSMSGLNHMVSMMEHINGIQYEDGFFGVYKNQMVCMVPTRLCENPISTVGLGDTIITNIFLKQLQYNQLIKTTL